MKEITTIKLKKSTVELLNKLKIHPRQPYEEVISGLIKDNEKKKSIGKKGSANIETYISFFIMIYVIAAFVVMEQRYIQGFATVRQAAVYEDAVNLQINGTYVYNWIPEKQGLIKGIKLSGSIRENGTARAWLEKDGNRYLIFDYDLLASKESYVGNVIGFAIKEDNATDDKDKDKDDKDKTKDKQKKDEELNLSNETLTNETTDNTINETEISNQTITDVINETINGSIDNATIISNTSSEIPQNITKSITISLEYNQNSPYDEDNDGKESINGIVDLTVQNTQFNWDADKSKLCARWETYSEDYGKSTTFCYGNEECCNSIGYKPLREKWNEQYYAAYNQYGAGLRNTISTQIIYYDFDLNGVQSEIITSEWSDLEANFYYGIASFDNACVETCLLGKLNDSSYRIVFEVENTALTIDGITYVIDEVIKQNEAPLLIKNITNINLVKNSNATINLSNYFYDEDELIYEYYKPGNLTILFEDDIATFVPDKEFTGLLFTYILANDKDKISISNVFAVNVTDIVDAAKSAESAGLVQFQAKVGQPVKWRKKVKIEELDGITINITNKAFNISLKKISQATEEAIDKSKVRVKAKDIIKDLEDYELGKISEKGTEDTNQSLELIINESIEPYVEEIAVEYQTEAPNITEENLNDNSKRITVSANLPYENVLAFTTIKDAPKNAIKLYWIKNDTKELFTNVSYYDLDNNTLIDYIEWIVPHLSNQTFEVSITILNVQSYPTVGGNWVVAFNTTGTGNLTITASNGTTYSELGIDNGITINDLTVSELKCNNSVLFNYNNGINDNSVYLVDSNNNKIKISDTMGNSTGIKSLYAENYNCDNLTGYYTVKVLTAGKHVQQFNFSDMITYANNIAVSGCTNFTAADTYDLDTPIFQNFANWCFYLNYSNIVLDGHGINITLSVSNSNIVNITANHTIVRGMNITETASLSNVQDIAIIGPSIITNVSIFNNTIFSSASSGGVISISLAVTNSNISITFNRIRHAGSSGITFGIPIFANISYNNLTGTSGTGITVGPASTLAQCNTTISNNNITIPTSLTFGIRSALCSGNIIERNNLLLARTTQPSTFGASSAGSAGIALTNAGTTSKVNIAWVRYNNVTTRSVGKFANMMISFIDSPILVGNTITEQGTGIALSTRTATTNLYSFNNTYMSNREIIHLNGSGSSTAANVDTNFTFVNDTLQACYSADGFVCNDTNITADIVLTENVTNVFMQDVHFNKTRINITKRDGNDGSEENNISVQWTFDLNVTDTNGNAITTATVQINDSKDTLLYSGAVDGTTGSIPSTLITEFTQNGSIVPFYQSCAEQPDERADATANFSCLMPLNISVTATNYNTMTFSYYLNNTNSTTVQMTPGGPVSGCTNFTQGNAQYDLDTPIFQNFANTCFLLNYSYTILDGHGINITTSVANAIVVNITANHTIVRGLNTTASGTTTGVRVISGGAGSQFANTNNITIFNNTIRYAAGIGISFVLNSVMYKNVSIIGNLITGTGAAISLDRISYFNISYNNISSADSDCIVIGATSSNVVQNNTIAYNKCNASSTPEGISVGGTDRNIIEHNEVRMLGTTLPGGCCTDALEVFSGSNFAPSSHNIVRFNNFSAIVSGGRSAVMYANVFNNLTLIGNTMTSYGKSVALMFGNGNMVLNLLSINNTYKTNKVGIMINASSIFLPSTNFTFINDTIAPCDSTGEFVCSVSNITSDIELTGNVTNVFMQDVKFNKTRINFTEVVEGRTEKSNISVQWTFDLNVTDTNGNAITTATVQINDSKDTLIYSGTVDGATGSIPSKLITEFTQNGSIVPFYQSCTEQLDERSDAIANFSCLMPLNISVTATNYNTMTFSYYLNNTNSTTVQMTPGGPVSGCTNFTQGNAQYDLDTPIFQNFANTCFLLNYSYITLDGHGINITQSVSNSNIVNISANHTIVRGMNITEAGSLTNVQDISIMGKSIITNVSIFNNTIYSTASSGGSIFIGTSVTNSNISVTFNRIRHINAGGISINSNPNSANISYNNITQATGGNSISILPGGLPVQCNATISNNNITQTGVAIGIRSNNCHGNIIERNQVLSAYTGALSGIGSAGGIVASSTGVVTANYVWIMYNNVTSRSSAKFASVIIQFFNNPILIGNTITAQGTGYALATTSTTTNLYSFNNTYMGNGQIILLNGSGSATAANIDTNFTFVNDTIQACYSADGFVCGDKNITADIVLTENVTNVFMQDVRFNKTRINITKRNGNDGSEENNISVQWTFDLNVTDTNGNAITTATVQINDSKDTLIYSGAVDATTGSIPSTLITEFTQNGSIVPFYQSCAEQLDERSDAIANFSCLMPLNISVVAGGYKSVSFSFWLNQTNKTSVEMVSGTSICDGGDIFTTCWINRTHYLNDSFNVFNATNVIINASGKLLNDTGNLEFRINLTGDLTIESGGMINLSGLSCTSGTCVSGGNLTILANKVNATGDVLLQGGLQTGSALDIKHGLGGRLILNSTNLYVYGMIDTSSAQRDAGSQSFGGNDAGSILINSSLVNITGSLRGNGGDGGTGTCDAVRGTRGSGGNITIRGENIYINSTISAQRGDYGLCNNGADGFVIINYTSSLDISTAKIERAPIITPFCDEGTLTGDSCNLTRRHGSLQIETINGVNFRIKTGGMLHTSRFPESDILLNFSNITVESNGFINLSGVSCSVNSCDDSGNLTIFSNKLNITGDVLLQGGLQTGSALDIKHGLGGRLILNSTNLYVYGMIDTSSAQRDAGSQSFGGNDAGSILINSSLVNITGSLRGNGGDGGTGTCDAVRGTRGSGGNITIRGENIYINSTISAQRGDYGLCNNGNGGYITINASNILELVNTSKIISAGNISGNIILYGKELYIAGIINTTNITATSSGLNGTIKLEYNVTINITYANITPAPFLTKENEFGRIEFIDRISGYASVDVNKSVNISNNLISVNSEGGYLNGSANLNLKGLSKNNTIFRNGVPCGSFAGNICTYLDFANSAVLFNVSQFTEYSINATFPVVNTTFNITSPGLNEIINFTGNITDDDGLKFANITYNISGVITYANYTISGTTAQISNVTAVCSSPCVLNFTMYATDIHNNVKQNSTLISVTGDTTAPAVNITNVNASQSLRIGNLLNISCYGTDETALSKGNITFNLTGKDNPYNFSFALSGLSAVYSQNITINLTRGNVINASCGINDGTNNAENSTLVTVADTLGSVFIGLNLTSPQINNVINVSGNCTDIDNDFSLGIISYNISGNPQKNYSFDLSNTGIKGNFSQNITINLTAGNVINFTAFCNDTIGTVYQNSTLITVAAAATTTTTTSGTSGGGGGGAGGGGGGGGLPIPTKEELIEFEVSKDEIKEEIEVGKEKIVRFDIDNKGTIPISVSVNVRNIEIVSIEKGSFEIESGASETAKLTIKPTEAGIFSGEVIVKSNGKQKVILIIIEAVTKNALFDIELSVPTAYSTVEKGGLLTTQINLFEVARIGKVDVTLNYIIKDTQNNVVFEESETFAVDGQKQYIKKFKIPESLAPGRYIIATEIVYQGGVAISSSQFEIVGEKPLGKLFRKTTLIPLIFVLVGLIYLFVMPYLPWKRMKRLK